MGRFDGGQIHTAPYHTGLWRRRLTPAAWNGGNEANILLFWLAIHNGLSPPGMRGISWTASMVENQPCFNTTGFGRPVEPEV